MKMSKGDGKQIEELMKCSLGDMEKWSVSEVMQESESSEKVLRPWRALQSLGVQRKDREELGTSSKPQRLSDPKEKLQQPTPRRRLSGRQMFLSRVWQPSSAQVLARG